MKSELAPEGHSVRIWGPLAVVWIGIVLVMVLSNDHTGESRSNIDTQNVLASIPTHTLRLSEQISFAIEQSRIARATHGCTPDSVTCCPALQSTRTPYTTIR